MAEGEATIATGLLHERMIADSITRQHADMYG